MSRFKACLPRLLTVALFLVLSVTIQPTATAYAQAASGITSPAPGSTVSGSVPVMGTAVIEPFQRYELYYKQEPNGDDSYIYFDGDTKPVVNGQLGIWETGTLPPGIYTIRMRVVKTDGNYAEHFAPKISVNQGPTPTPTSDEPTPTPIPTATFTPVPQPTAVVGTVEQPDLGEATATPEATEALIAMGSEGDSGTQDTTSTESDVGAVAQPGAAESSGNSLTDELGAALSIQRLRTQFFRGVRISAAVFLLVVAIFAGKRLLEWTLSRM